jgi:hypothetical protein
MPTITPQEDLLLTFFGDGPYWTDFIHLLACPPGCSYVHPFRYDENWVDPRLSTLLTSTTQGSTLAKRFRSLVIGARFGSSHSLLPLRKAELLFVERNGPLLFYFRVNEFVSTGVAQNLNARCITIPDPAHNYLAFSADMCGTLDAVSNDDESEHWKHLTTALATDTSLPINPQARRSIFLRPHAPLSGRGKSSKPRLLSTSHSGLPHYGFALYPGRTYDMSVSYRIPCLEGAKTTIGEFQIKLEGADPSQLSLSTATLSCVGNYGKQDLEMEPRNSTAVPSTLMLAPPAQSTPQDGSANVLGTTTSIRYRRKFSLLHWMWATAIPTVLLFLLLILIQVSEVIKDNLESIIKGDLSLHALKANWPYCFIVFIVGAFGAGVLQHLIGKGR